MHLKSPLSETLTSSIRRTLVPPFRHILKRRSLKLTAESLCCQFSEDNGCPVAVQVNTAVSCSLMDTGFGADVIAASLSGNIILVKLFYNIRYRRFELIVANAIVDSI